MTTAPRDAGFTGGIAELYERVLVPMIFAPCARDLAERVAALAPNAVLETACGTGVVSRALAARLPPGTEIVATDLNQPMLDCAARVGTAQPVHWQRADAQQLPFEDARFDAVVCQFGVMFLPDKPGAYAQARRVLRPGGTLLFNVWDAIEHNEVADVVTQALAALFPADPPRFLARTPHGHGDRDTITRDLAQAGFTARPTIERLTLQSVSPSPHAAALAYCQGTPLANEIVARGGSLADATDACAAAVAARFGAGTVIGTIQALVVSVTR